MKAKNKIYVSDLISQRDNLLKATLHEACIRAGIDNGVAIQAIEVAFANTETQFLGDLKKYNRAIWRALRRKVIEVTKPRF